jgi:hypothetical protein
LSCGDFENQTRQPEVVETGWQKEPPIAPR